MQFRQVITFFSMLAAVFLIVPSAFAQEAAAVAGQVIDVGLRDIGAGLAIGVAAAGGSLGMGLALHGALTGTARNPNVANKLFSQLILGMALIESLVIYALVIAFMIKAC